MRKSLTEIDDDTPALIVKVGQYPMHPGGVAAIRTLGRIGVPVYAMTENRFTPAALSRYLTGRFLSRSTGREQPEELAAAIRDIGQRIGRRSVLIPTDDEAAVLIAEHASVLSESFLFPRISSDLPRKLASKWGLYELCRKHDIPTPASVLPSSKEEVAAFAADCTFPVVVKHAEPWLRLRAPVVSKTTVLHTPGELLALPLPVDEPPGIILQEYIPWEHAEDWMVTLYCDANSTCLLSFSGTKVRCLPPHAGMAACARAVDNPLLTQLAERFGKEIGYQGIADLDWRLDRRDGQYKLVDFNPRVGNAFRLFETTSGVDVVRALHLDLTGRTVPSGQEPKQRKLVIEDADLLARIAYKRSGNFTEAKQQVSAPTELAWLAPDDPIPFFRMLLSLLTSAFSRFTPSLRK